jgi:hypothetical protein
MVHEILWELPLDKAVEAYIPLAQQPRWLAIPKLPFHVEVRSPVVSPMLLQVMKDIVRDAYKKCVKISILGILLSADKEYGHCEDFNKLRGLREKMLNDIQGELRKANNEALKNIEDFCLRHQELQRQWQSLKLEKALNFATGAVGVAGSAVGLAAGPVSVLAILGMYRAVTGLAKDLVECYQSAEEVQKKIRESLESLRGTYEKSKTAGVGREMGAAVANAAKLPIEIGTNVEELKKQNELWKGKLGHLYSLAFNLADKLNPLLDAAEALGKGLVDTDPDSKKKKAALAKLEANVRSLLDDGVRIPSMRGKVTISGAYTRAAEGLKAQERVEQGLKALTGQRGGWVDWLNMIIPLVASVSFMAAGTTHEVSELVRDPNVGKTAVAGVKAFNEGFEIGIDEVGPTIAAAFGFDSKEFETVEELERKNKKELDVPRPRSNAIGSMAHAKAGSFAAGKAKS